MTGPGLQPERTSLAWQRTGVAGAALSATAMLSAAHLAAPWVFVTVAVVSAGCAVAAAVAVRSAALGRRGGGSVWTHLVAVALIPVLLAAATAAMALAPS